MVTQRFIAIVLNDLINYPMPEVFFRVEFFLGKQMASPDAVSKRAFNTIRYQCPVRRSNPRFIALQKNSKMRYVFNLDHPGLQSGKNVGCTWFNWET
ncbi:hypothetical protein NPIL_178631 [Nephila pilipes]|uniref:Uncharacterized protein n=1 Tax=Nephila pilipes TaxID=299642 RepID=A0A8X6TC07_NEPPI|nr:hypothetical protein NPIL_178631 [Nephila pilipes]